MILRRFIWILLFAAIVPAGAQQTDKARWVLLVARRSGVVEAVDPATLKTIGAIRTGTMTDWVSSRPDGRTLLVALPSSRESQNCCGLYSLDLESAKMYPLIFPAMRAVLSTDGHGLFTQRGNVGIDTVDLLTLARGPVVGPPGKTYFLQRSPYRRWLFGVTYEPSPSLDIFDLKTNTLARSLAIPGNPELTGAWVGNTYYLLGYGKGKGTLWSVTPETEKLPDAKPVNLRDVGGDCRVPGSKAKEPLMLQPPLGAGGRLYVYEGFGYKFDRRDCANPPSGGLYVIDPSSGAVVGRLAPSLYFLRVVANCDGTELYGIEVGPTLSKDAPRLIRLDARTGKILASRAMDGGMAVHLALASLYDSVIPRGEVQATVAAAPSWIAACPVTTPALDEPPPDPNASPFGFGEWYINDRRTIWFPRQDWQAKSGNKVILIRPAGVRLEISGRRLDEPAPALQVDGMVSDSPGSSFEVIGMSFPAEGCWEITAKGGNNELRFVTTVSPARKNLAAVGDPR
jgi:hypothetical protein